MRLRDEVGELYQDECLVPCTQLRVSPPTNPGYWLSSPYSSIPKVSLGG